MDKIKILYLVSALKKCGPVNVLHGIVSGLDKNKFDIYILSLSGEERYSAREMFEGQASYIGSLNNSRLTGLVSNRRKIQNLVDRFEIDITHSHGIRADHINSRLNNVIRFNTIHNFPSEDYMLRYGKATGTLMELMHKKAIAKIDHPVACSRAVSDKFLSNYGIRTALVQNGIDTAQFFPDKEKKPELRNTLGLPPDKTIFVVSSALTTLKNPGIIIEAFNQMQDRNLILLFIGDGHLLQSLSMANRNDSVLFRGRVDNVADYLKACDYYISASLTEGLPNAVLEAMGTGLPPLLSNIPAHTEIVGPSYPYLFDPEDVAGLLDKMKRVLKKDNQVISGQFESKINSQFSTRAMSEKYASLYLEQIHQTSVSL